MARHGRRWTLPLACAFALGCGPTGDPGRILPSEVLVRSLIEAQQGADTVLLESLFWPDATYDDFPNQLEYRGIEEIVDYVTSVHAWGDDVYINVSQVHASEGGATAEWLFSAIQNRPMGDLVPLATGQEVLLNGVTVIEVEGDRIIRAADYTDTAPIALQLGGRIEMPGGATLELTDRR